MEATDAMDTTELTDEDISAMGGDTTDDESGGGAPGFGLGLAALAVLGAAVLALRQR